MTAIVTVDRLTKTFPTKVDGAAAHLTAVDDVSFSIERGETLGLVGESGCGKSTLARLILRLDPPSDGRILIGDTDIGTLSGARLKAARRKFQMVFQDPYASLNPRMTVRAIIAEPLRNYRVGGRREIEARVGELAGKAGLSDYHLDRYPHELSGGQAQRVGIARAIALSPDLIVADEPVSALDVSIQAQVINLIAALKRDLGLTMIFISHDLSVVAHVADRVAVMYLGRIIELAPAAALFAGARHPYTRALVGAVPKPNPPEPDRKVAIRGELPSPTNRPAGCHFHPRCPFADDTCRTDAPQLRGDDPAHLYACHHADRLPASGNGAAS